MISISSAWLRDEECLKGAIQDRTKAVLVKFQHFVKANVKGFEHLTKSPLDDIIKEITECKTNIINILNAYLRGDLYIALKSTKTMVANMWTSAELPGLRLYKAREGESNFLFPEDEMFHIPFNKRDKIGNQRYSISGVPCLYLGSSSYVCWEELGRVDFDMCNFCGYTNIKPIEVFDLSIPSTISSLSDIKRLCIILACCLSAKRDAMFKEEYILPQLIFQALILRHHYNHKDFCVKYISTHLLNGDADCFDYNYSVENVSRYYNYVFPAAESKIEGHSERLKSYFKQTTSVAMFREKLVSLTRLISGENDDVYLNSQFGLMDALLDEKLGLDPIRKEVKFVTK